MHAFTQNAKAVLSPRDGHVHLVGVSDEAQVFSLPGFAVAVAGTSLQLGRLTGTHRREDDIRPLTPCTHTGATERE